MHLEILTAEQVTVLERLSGLTPIQSFYLAGGTALALRHGHRRSIDFDFFRKDPFDSFALASALELAFDRFERLPSGEHTLHVRLQGVSASFFRYRHPLVVPAQPTQWGFTLAADEDIAAMKLEAIAGRGSRKDFVDLYLLCRNGMTLEAVFDLFERRYGTARTERYHRLRALAFFEDAERQPLPDMLVELDWSDVTAFFASEASRLLAEGLAK
jgi:hypothetical protein